MEKDNNLLENDQLFKNLFEYSEDKDEELYKNDLFIPSTEEDGIFQENNKTNRMEIIRDKILKKISLEDYILFPPKNDSILITENDPDKNKEDQEKLFEEEIDHLRNLHRLSYLTFSPFGLSFYPNINSITQKNDEQNGYANETEEEIEKQNKILNIIDFDYNNYEINNDLLFNISMGFVDIDKLKHENAVSSENFEPRSERFTNGRQLKNVNIKPKAKEPIKEDKEEKMAFNKDVELKSNLMNKLVKFVKEHENIEFFSSLINDFYKDLDVLQGLNNNNEKNIMLLKWEKIFIDRNKLYQKYLVDQKEKERRKRKEERLRKELEKLIEDKKIFKIQQESKFEEELNKLRNKGYKKENQNRQQSLYLGSGNIAKQLNFSKDLNITHAIKSLYTMRSASSISFSKKLIRQKSTGKKIMNVKSISKKKTKSSNKDNDDNKRYGYHKSRSDYFFKHI